MSDKLLSKLQAANLLGISALKLDRLRQSGEIAYIKIGSRVLLRIEDLQEFIQRNRHESNLNNSIHQTLCTCKQAG